MYLSLKEVELLDSAIKYFEVGLRTYIAECIIRKYPTKSDYKTAIQAKKSNYKGEEIILSPKIQSFLEEMSKTGKVNSLYELLTETKDICDNKKTVEIKRGKNNGFIVIHDLIQLTYIFGTDVFADLLKNFSTREEYMYLAGEYRVVRNSIEHPGSRIRTDSYSSLNRFITLASKGIQDKCFWYGSKSEMQKKLDSLSVSINNPLRITNNLATLPIQKYKFVCRTKEIEEIRKYLQGNEQGMGRMHYIMISGFGGMGKTSLIIETIMQMIYDYNNETVDEKRWFDFILFFTSKEEELNVDALNRINKISIKRQISSLEDIKAEIENYLGTSELESIEKRGLIVIDNFETLSEEEKLKINDFIIYHSAQEVQFVITSRNDEHIGTNYQLQLQAFSEEDGIDFINKYIDENDLDIDLTLETKRKLITLSKGNTIVLVLSLNRLARGVELKQIDRELSLISSETITNIVSFMAMNSFDEIYKQFADNEEEITSILQTLIMYDDPIDKYSLMRLSNTNIVFIDKVVDALCSGLILEQHREEISINDFAKKYLLIKFNPNNIEYMQKENEIREYKRQLAFKKASFMECRNKYPQIDTILREWQPNNIIDELAILEAFQAYYVFEIGKIGRKNGRKNYKHTLEEINEYFDRITETSTHPYIYSQKARILLPLLQVYSLDKNKVAKCLEEAFEKTIYLVETQYTSIKGTMSYASVIRGLGYFYLGQAGKKDYRKAANYSEKARDIYTQIGAREDNYYALTNYNLIEAYKGLYEKTHNKMYRSEIEKLAREVSADESFIKNEKIAKICEELGVKVS